MESSRQQNQGAMNPVVLDLVYKSLISSVSVDVATRVHRMMKKGIYPSSELLVPKSRSEVYPQVYDKKDIGTEEKEYSVEVPQRNKRKRVGEEEEDEYQKYIRVSIDAPAAEAAAAASSSNNPEKAPDNAISTPSQIGSKQPPPPAPAPPQQYLDIWGKAPPKEPKDMVECLICGRQVNTLRFAPHLDKCMGIGTTVRAAALAASGFVPGAVGSTTSNARAPPFAGSNNGMGSNMK